MPRPARLPACPVAGQGGWCHPKSLWPGWDHDEASVASYVPRIAAAVKGSADWRRLAEAWLALNPELAKAQQDPRAIELIVTGAAQAIASALAALLTELWHEAWDLGVRAVQAIVGPRGRPVGTERLDAILADARNLAAHAANTRAGKLAIILEQALAGDGMTVDELAAALLLAAGDEGDAELIAWTEFSRAHIAAAVQAYLDNGIAYARWQTVHDARVCRPCRANEAAGPTPVGQPYPSGVPWPPDHPRCRCALLPAPVPAMVPA